MTYLEEMKQHLTELAQELKDNGLKVYIHKPLDEKAADVDRAYHGRWFYVTDGKNIVTISVDSLGVIGATMDYIPNRESGSGCMILSNGNPQYPSCTTENILQWFKTPHTKYLTPKQRRATKFYKDEQEWYNKLWHKEDYVVL